MKWLILLLIPMRIFADTGTFLHRAIEPARMGLDVSIVGEKVTAYVMVGAESLEYLSDETDKQQVYQALKETAWFVLSVDARCRVVDHSVHQQADRIKGFQILRCERPGKLKSIDIDLYNRIPMLKAVDVWLTSQRWQKKTTVYPDHTLVNIRSGMLP
ncbi:hypothetical protein [uncultured Endozoicomonas sp.]|uniref:ZrgA family zinc uptake protein n=1 Tax=uncultured Endozoicomonas sp. TaxID=432652 RepID=UPI00260C1CCC|nr:hypothetical protein [uncultured Endozoicomonas sp.]